MKQFNAPIPGESLTHAPKKFPWERPPEMHDPEDVIKFYVDKLNRPEMVESIANALDLGQTVKSITEGLVRLGVAKTHHSIDVGLIVSPVIHEAVKTIGEHLGIDYDEGLVDKKAEEDRKNKFLKAKLMKMMSDYQPEDVVGEVLMEEETPEEDATDTGGELPGGVPEEAPFMQRRV